jgi:membrane AbrB-like protein
MKKLVINLASEWTRISTSLQSLPALSINLVVSAISVTLSSQWKTGLLLIAVFASGCFCKMVHLPAAWLIGSLITSAIFSMKGWARIALPRSVYLLLQAVIGVTLAGTFSMSSLTLLSVHWIPVSLVILLMLGFTVLNAIYLIYVNKLHPATAMLGSLPGGAGEMTAISEQFGADPRLVSVIQYARLLIIIISVSLISHVLGSFISAFHVTDVGMLHAGLVLTTVVPQTMTNFFLCVAVALCGGVLGTVSRIPCGTLMVPMVMAIVMSVQGHAIAWPDEVLALAYSIMGMMIGSRFDEATLAELKRLCAPLLLTTLFLMIGSIVLTVLFVCWMPINGLSSFLAATPGGLDSIAVMANELNADSTVVLTVHFCRLMLVLILGPQLVRVFSKTFQKRLKRAHSLGTAYTSSDEKYFEICPAPCPSGRPR